jgi:hypothetical protein
VKGTVPRDFRPSVFFHQSIHPREGGLIDEGGLVPDSQDEAVSHMASNSPRNSIRKSPKLASMVSMRPQKPIFFAGVPL